MNVSTLIFLIIVCATTILFGLAPDNYDYSYNCVCAILYVIMAVVFFIVKKKKNYMDFDTIFIFTYSIVFYFFPVFIYPIDQSKLFVFAYKYNEDVISRASAIALIGMNCYMLGSIIREKQQKKWSVSKGFRNGRFLFLISLASFIVYFLLGGITHLKQLYEGEVTDAGNSGYFSILSSTALMAMLVIWFNNQYLKHNTNFSIKEIPFPQISYVIIYTALQIYGGSRTYPMQFLLIIIGLYTLLFNNFSLKKTSVFISIGVIAMYGVLLFRSRSEFQINDLASVLSDLIINSRNSYVAVDYVDTHGLSFGTTMIMYLIAPFPFLQNFIVQVFGINPSEMSSSLLITCDTLGNDPDFGLGTNIIADIYLAFGTFGVAVFMIILGYFVCSLQKGAKTNIYALTAYAIMMSYSVFLVRAEYFFFLRPMLWTLLFIWLFKKSAIKPI